MRRIDRYLLREGLPPLLFGLLLYSALAVVSVTIPRLQWVIGTPLGALGRWLLLQFPTAVVQTLPISQVLAVLLAFGRLASGRELLAMQTSAIPLGRVAASFLALGLAGVLVSLSFNEWVLPQTNARVGALYWQLTSGGSGLFRLASKNIDLGNFTLTFEDTDRATDQLFDVRVEHWEGRRLTVLFASRAVFEPTGLRLFGYTQEVIDLEDLEQGGSDAEELLQRLLPYRNRPADPEQSLLLTTSTTVAEIITRFGGGGFEDPRSVSQAYRDARRTDLSWQDRRQAQVLFHRKLSEPLANLTLLLLAVPISILYARSRGVAFGLSLVVTLAWYLLLTLGQLFAQAGVLPVWLGLWLGNFLLAALGIYLLLERTYFR